jgi:phosphoglycerate kinase
MVQVCCSDRYAGCGAPPAAAPAPASTRPANDDSCEPLSDVISQLLSPSFDVTSPSLELAGKRVLLRADLNVPVENGAVSDANRIDGVLPTIRLLQSRGARVVIASHFGRPEPSKQSWQQMLESSSLAPVAAHLQQQLGDSFLGLAPDCVGPQVEAAVAQLQLGQVGRRRRGQERLAGPNTGCGLSGAPRPHAPAAPAGPAAGEHPLPRPGDQQQP